MSSSPLETKYSANILNNFNTRRSRKKKIRGRSARALRRLQGDAVGAELVDDEGDYIYIYIIIIIIYYVCISAP